MSTRKNCAPCADCPPTPAPVMPRCDVVLADGSFANATVIVEGGCITGVQAGTLQVYTPDECCPTGGTGGGGDGLDGPPGPAGQNASIAIGSVTTVPFGTPPTVVNSGTPTNAILDFEIPQGEDGADGEGAGGLTTTAGGIEFQDGLLQTVPVQWPPIMLINDPVISTPGVTMTFVKDPATGIVAVSFDMSAFVTSIEAGFQAQIDALNGDISTINSQMSALQTQIISLQTALLTCCPGAEIDIDGDGSNDPGGTPGTNPSPPVAPN